MEKKIRESDVLLAIVLVLVTCIGGFVRMQPALNSIFPLNDGGLFYTMTMDLKSNGFALPQTTTYNLADIPFAYPPFAFYFTGLLSSLTGWQVLDIIRILPPFISTLTISAFFLLAQKITRDNIAGVLATLVFAFIPRTFDWLVMGGGITRSFGLLFVILALWQVYQFIEQHQIKNLLFFIFLSALVVSTHPEAAVHLAIGTVTFYLIYDRSKKSLFYLSAAVVAVVVLTVPWWATVLQRHGIDPFVAASRAARDNSYNAIVGLIVLFRYHFTDEPFTAIFAGIGLVGMFRLIAQRKFLLPVWFFAAHLLEPRGGTLYMMLPLAMAAGVGLAEVILPALKLSGESQARFGKVAHIFLVLLFFYGTFSANFSSSKILTETTLNAPDLAAFDWVKGHTAPDSKFAIITGENALRDPTSEWFPSMTLRRSQATIFGYEWVNDGRFIKKSEEYTLLQDCAFQEVECLEKWRQNTGLMFNYIYIRKMQANKIIHTTLEFLLRQDSRYKILYESSQVDIFEHLAPK